MNTVCHTCAHPAGDHVETGTCPCGCTLFIRPGTPRATLRNVAREWGWVVKESAHLDQFRRCSGHHYVLVIYAGETIFGVNTPLAYFPEGPDVVDVAAAALAG